MSGLRGLGVYENEEEKETFEQMADIYSIFLATEALEKLYIRDCVSHEEYTSLCSKLIAQYKTCLNALGGKISIRKFLDQYQIKCPAAIHRLVEMGVPATTEHISSISSSSNISKHIAETVQLFITLLDSLKLNMTAVDQVHPLLSDLIQSLSSINTLPSTYEGRNRMILWLKRLNQMRASEELSSDDARQLSFDIETSLTEFHRCLASAR